MYRKIIMIAAAATAAFNAYARHEAADTLDVAVVTAEKGLVVSRTDTVSLESPGETSHQMRLIPALSIMDFGGHAGLKTASLRGLGTAHTAIFMDGIRVGNQQNGQPDLSMIGSGFFKTAVIDYAQNSIDFISTVPSFGKTEDEAGKRTSTEISFFGGSFHTYIPSLSFGWKVSEKLTMSFNADLTSSKGDFPYSGKDEEGRETNIRRTGNDILQMRASLDLFGEGWKVKTYANSSERGAPGSTDRPTGDRQKDGNLLMQGSLNRRFGRIYRLRLSVKGSYDTMEYHSSWGSSRYEQTEFQLNTSHIFTVNDWWKVSYALGGQSDMLRSGNYSLAEGNTAAKDGIFRHQLRSSAATRLSFGRFKGDLALEYEWTRDAEKRRQISSTGTFSPSASLRFNVSEGLDLVAFGRKAYRLPMFNELYYIGFGNRNLKPEKAWLTGAGAEWTYDINRSLSVSAKADGFFNRLENKITSAPSDYDPNIWLPYNIGKVLSYGSDVYISLGYASGKWQAGTSARYTLQQSKDMTAGSGNYGRQIPYIAKHSTVLTGEAAWKGWSVDLRFNFRSGRSDSSGTLPDWSTLDACIAKEFSISRNSSGAGIRISLSANNMADTRYEISRGYPMPGRSVMAGATMIF